MKDEQKYHALKAQFVELLNEYQFLKRQYEANFENECLEVKNEEEGNQQMNIQQESERIDELESQTHEILSTLHEINETTRIVNEELKKQQNYIQSIDAVTEKTNSTLEEGNKELDKAKGYQTKCRI